MATEHRYPESLGELSEFLEGAVEFVEEKIGENEKVVLSLSGGVDSSTVAEIFRRAIGDRLYPVHFDTGFMRSIHGRSEVDIIADRFSDYENFRVEDKKDLFQERIFGFEDAEEKRLAFRETYEEALNEVIKDVDATAITQGTIRPDIEETEAQIKSQNNVDTDFDVEKLVEPIAGLVKPEVRKLAKEVGFSEEVYLRQPFLGPGLSARTIGKIDKNKLKCERKANDLLERFVENYFTENYGRKALWDEKTGSRIPFQYFTGTFDKDMERAEEIDGFLGAMNLDSSAYRLREKATGVSQGSEGRERVYSSPVLIEGDLEEITGHKLGEKIPKEFDTSRVLYKLSESTKDDDYLVSMRAVGSEDAINAEPLNIPFEELKSFADKIKDETDAGIVAYDLTPKPPATIEYE